MRYQHCLDCLIHLNKGSNLFDLLGREATLHIVCFSIGMSLLLSFLGVCFFVLGIENELVVNNTTE